MEGSGLATATALNLPDLMCATTVPAVANIRCTSPPISALTAGEALLKGIRVRFTPAIALNNSAARCVEDPVEPEATFKSPGLAFASAMSSLTDLTGNEGWT